MTLPNPLMITPMISTIIATYNRSSLLPLAVNSILSQTYQDFEIIIVDDASTDDTRNVIEDFKKSDARISSYHLQENRGPGFARNLGISHARGKYIAIMDDDDLSHQERFARQVAFLEAHPDIMIVGTFIQKIDQCGNNIGEIHYPLTSGQIRWGLFFRCSVGHATTMIRKTVFSEHGYSYSDSINIAEDWKLFVDVIQDHRISNLPEVLYSYRRYPDSITVKEPELELKNISEIIITGVKRSTGLDLPENLVRCFVRPNLIKTKAEGQIISDITRKLYEVALTWNLSAEDKRSISENAASRLRQIWQTLNYPFQLLPYVIFSLLIDPSVVTRRILQHKT